MLNTNVLSAIQAAKDYLGDEYVLRLQEARNKQKQVNSNPGSNPAENSNIVRFTPANAACISLQRYPKNSNEVALTTAFINELYKGI